jgi:hypothetical protein
LTLISEAEQRQEKLVATVVKATGALESWRHDVEGEVDDLKLKMSKLTKYMDRSVFDNSPASIGLISSSPQLPEQTAACSSAGNTAARPSGHHDDMTPRVDGEGGKLPLTHSPTNGTHSDANVGSSQFHGTLFDHQHDTHPLDTAHINNGHLPKLNFPSYEGETTRLWISQAEDYFKMYTIPPHHWVKVSRMHFRGVSTRWIESIHHPDRIPWPNFCKMLHNRFGHDLRDHLSRQMFHIHQTSTVLEYVERFSSLFDQLKAYQIEPDMHYYTTRFVDGLRHDICVAVAIQRPSTLDTAYALTLL